MPGISGGDVGSGKARNNPKLCWANRPERFRILSVPPRNRCRRNKAKIPSPGAPPAGRAVIATLAVRESALFRGARSFVRKYGRSSFPTANSARWREQTLDRAEWLARKVARFV